MLRRLRVAFELFPMTLPPLRRICSYGLLGGLLFGLLAGVAGAQTATEPVGLIEGDDVAVKGQAIRELAKGRSSAPLASGAEVTVRSGSARIELTGGGEIGVCGPARFTLLRSGTSLTLALDFGQVQARLNNPLALSIYTPQIVLTPVAGQASKPLVTSSESREAPADEILVGLAETGKMCIYAKRGAVRIQQQFGNETIVVPQNVEAALSDGHLDSITETPQACLCSALSAPRRTSQPEVRVETGVRTDNPPPAGPDFEKDVEKKEEPAKDLPIWKVVMPPLTFNAGSPAPPLPSPESIQLLREVRVESSTVFTGQVTPPVSPPPVTVAKQSDPAQAAAKKPGFGARVANFFRRLFGGKSKNEPKQAGRFVESPYIPS
jgi:hypothetical protein